MPGEVDPTQRREARVALAMLPVGATLLLVSAIALPAVAALAIDMMVRQPVDWGWIVGWCVCAGGVGLLNMRSGIAMMCAFDWRPLPFASLRSAAVVAGWLALP